MDCRSGMLIVLPVLLVLGVLKGWAQLVVHGRVLDVQQRTPIPGATVVAFALSDTARRWGAVANAQGEVRLELPGPGQYRLRVSSVGYRTLERVLSVERSHSVGDLPLEPVALQTHAVTVEALQERASVKQDTVEYSASAYKVNPEATAEELVRKLPGVTLEGGQLRAHGEVVRRVLVDGREFFGQDPLAVLRNLPADLVQAVQVFDRESEQARLTGIRDPSSSERTLNLITTPALRTGQFGRIYGGYGSAARYQAGATLNLFRGATRMSVVGMSNNVNQQNFSLDEVLGVVNFAAQQAASGGPPLSVLRMLFQGGRFPGPPSGMRGGPGGPFGQIGSFFVPEQNGLNTTHAFGLMYSNRWEQGLDVTGSYFFNTLVNTTDGVLQRQYFSAHGGNVQYAEESHTSGKLGTHRLNLRMELPFDTATTLLVVPRMTFQPSSTGSSTTSLSMDGSDTLSRARLASTTTARMLQGSTQLLLVRRFAPGRSLSLELEGTYTPQRQRYTSRFSSDVRDTSSPQQLSRQQALGSVTATVTYSEPLDSLHILQLRYAPSWERADGEQQAYWEIPPEGQLVPSDLLSSSLWRQVWEQRAGMAYLYQGRILQWNVRLDYSWQHFRAEERWTAPWSVERRFSFWFPFVMVEYRPQQAQNLRVVYRPFVTLPSASQLQRAVDNSNPLALVAGNPELRPSYTHMLFARYNATNPLRGHLLFAMVRLMYGVNYIGMSTLLASRDTVVGGLRLPAGGQYTVPVNLDGYWSGRLFGVVGMPTPWLRSTLTLTTSLDYTQTPAIMNGARVQTRQVVPAVGVTLSSNWSERIDFTASYTLAHTLVQTTAPTGSSRYLQQRLSADVTVLPWGSWVLASQLRWSKYTGLGEQLDRPVTLWSVAIGYRFLENKAAEVRLLINDVLNQNTGISRTVTGQYLEDSTTRVLGRYALLQLSYRLRNIGL